MGQMGMEWFSFGHLLRKYCDTLVRRWKSGSRGVSNAIYEDNESLNQTMWPGSRAHVCTWTVMNNVTNELNHYMFGGYGYDNSSADIGVLNDLWAFHPKNLCALSFTHTTSIDDYHIPNYYSVHLSHHHHRNHVLTITIFYITIIAIITFRVIEPTLVSLYLSAAHICFLSLLRYSSFSFIGGSRTKNASGDYGIRRWRSKQNQPGASNKISSAK